MATQALPANSARQYLPLLLVMALGSLLAWFFYFQHGLQPQEDAAMLMRYAKHLAEGKGLSWNPGGTPVDGATDFLFMMMVAALTRIGLQVEVAALLLNLAAHFGTIALVFRILLRQPGGNVWAATFAAMVMASGPGLSYVEAGFGAPVFAFFGLLSFESFLLTLQKGYADGKAGRFAFFGLITGLIRPEGVLLCLGMLAAMAWKLDGREQKRLFINFGLIFGIPGAIYFAWHWWFFGYPLPNPFYVKGGGKIYPSSLNSALIGIAKMSLVLVPLMLFGIWKRVARSENLYLLWPIAFFAGIWLLMSNAMNYNHRFQYVVMPMIWVLWLPLLRNIWPEWSLKGWRLALGAAAAIAMIAFQCSFYTMIPRVNRDGRAELGKALADFQAKNYCMAITEAGNLPLYSDWKAIDTWGLNDAAIAHAGRINSAYLDQHSPELVMIHDYWSPGQTKQRPNEPWAAMTDTLEAYLAANRYEMVACWGRNPDDAHFYYLKPAFEGRDSLAQVLRNFPYRWHEDGELARNFLQEAE